MKELLQSKYNVNTTYSRDALNLLARRFPDNIKLFAAYKNEEMIANVVTYETDNVLHTQYIGSSEQGRKLGAVELALDYLINEYNSKKKFFDFGISTENGCDLNTGWPITKNRLEGAQ